MSATTYAQGAIPTTPATIVSAGTTRADAAPLTSCDCLIDASAGPASGVILPNMIQGLGERQNLRIASLGPGSVNLYTANVGDPALPIATLPAFQCWEFAMGSGVTYAATRVW
jgi:hypothetical protein